ncbi:isoleucine--tRNA ligase [Campylobacter canadensis]|uniref:isoleucine--tRNA ligase n=1 Tax=Campylobacter canadensis TaxID=449520 RepID=UPI001CCF49F4|nr:isoleucine--tRNA ligase [Campylobacter canadensis]MBZ7997263.1 isoleucine--tRNA ligase [Campylobacter canadensis]MBZ8000869.1 isoleucine--tRNA ligase [Campylobacter canadensis]MBZ8002685.1 isoleucine--tRNA ligase [Campylobacter canadensis]
MKDTLLLPQTEFAMRANLYENEKHSFDEFSKYAYKLISSKKASTFILHDGPPYANGHLHVGHAINKILKDMINKTEYFLNNKSIHYTAGWDCHGLPIEQQVEIKLKDTNPSIKQIHDACTAHAKEFVQIQKKEFQDLGIIADFDNPYLTMDFKFEANIYKCLLEVAKNSLLIQRQKPVYWSWAAKSALAEAEVEYQDKQDYSIFVAFKLNDDAKNKLKSLNIADEVLNNARAVIWTTTPWTLPANQAIALNKDEEYIISKNGLIVAKKRVQDLSEFNLEEIASFKGDFLENTHAINPLNNRLSKLIVGEHVTMDGGSGLVHTAPGHGEDDYYVCLKYNIPVIMPVDDGGCYDESILELVPKQNLKGMHIFKANEVILELLGDALLKQSTFIHSYPFCWRTHKPVIYRATKQFFIAMDKKFYNNMSLRELALSEIDKINFYPQSGKNRLKTMIENRPDWCISRQRSWGVPLAFFLDENNELIMDYELYEHLASLFEKEGVRIWWQKEIKDLLPQNCKYDANKLSKVNDILDVWFDSGSTFACVLDSGNYGIKAKQASMYLEGSDQHRGWFQSSLLLSCIINKQAPYKSVLTHGFTVDKNGRKMSKSLGNVIAPSDIAKKYGIEILRLYIASSDYSSDIKLGEDILNQASEQYRKIRNTIRFLLANTNDLEKMCYEFSELDLLFLNKADEVFKLCKKSFLEYDFAKGINALATFLSADLSGIYLDVCKDSLYCDAKNSTNRMASQSAMVLILQKLFIYLAPILTHTINEAFKVANKLVTKNVENIFMLTEDEINVKKSSFEYEKLVEFRQDFYEQIDILKKDKKIKSTLELAVISSNEEMNSFKENCKFLNISAFCKSDLDFVKIAEFKQGFIAYAKDCKCPRCWRYLSKDENSLCLRCSEAIK